jgi:hypothetical protein
MHYITIEKKVTKAKTITFMQYNLGIVSVFCFLFTVCFFIPQTSFAQKVDSTKDVTAKHPKAAKIVKNIPIRTFFSLHYTDRKKDRILDGAEDFEQFRGKKLNAIHYQIA